MVQAHFRAFNVLNNKNTQQIRLCYQQDIHSYRHILPLTWLSNVQPPSSWASKEPRCHVVNVYSLEPMRTKVKNSNTSNRVFKDQLIFQWALLQDCCLSRMHQPFYSCSNYLSFILFVDDSNIFFQHKYISELNTIVNHELSFVATWFKANKLLCIPRTLNLFYFTLQERK